MPAEDQEELKPLIKALRNRKQFHMLKVLKRLRKLEEKEKDQKADEDNAAKLDRKRAMAGLQQEVEEIRTLDLQQVIDRALAGPGVEPKPFPSAAHEDLAAKMLASKAVLDALVIFRPTIGRTPPPTKKPKTMTSAGGGGGGDDDEEGVMNRKRRREEERKRLLQQDIERMMVVEEDAGEDEEEEGDDVSEFPPRKRARLEESATMSTDDSPESLENEDEDEDETESVDEDGGQDEDEEGEREEDGGDEDDDDDGDGDEEDDIEFDSDLVAFSDEDEDEDESDNGPLQRGENSDWSGEEDDDDAFPFEEPDSDPDEKEGSFEPKEGGVEEAEVEAAEDEDELEDEDEDETESVDEEDSSAEEEAVDGDDVSSMFLESMADYAKRMSKGPATAPPRKPIVDRKPVVVKREAKPPAPQRARAVLGFDARRAEMARSSAARPEVMLDKATKLKHKSNTQRDMDKAARRRKTSNAGRVHASWILKKRMREKQANATFRGRRVVFA